MAFRKDYKPRNILSALWESGNKIIILREYSKWLQYAKYCEHPEKPCTVWKKTIEGAVTEVGWIVLLKSGDRMFQNPGKVPARLEQEGFIIKVKV